MKGRKLSNTMFFKGLKKKTGYIVNSNLNSVMKLDQNCIVKQGYLVKSPPLEKILNKVARWHLRWFVLYDTKPRADLDPLVEREMELYYYSSSESQMQGDLPKGKINLMRVEIYANPGKLHGFPHVINIQTEQRTYHLCATQKPVHKEWLFQLNQHSIPPAMSQKKVAFGYGGTMSHKPIKRELTTGTIKARKSSLIESSPNRTAPTSPTQRQPQNPFWATRYYIDPTLCPMKKNTRSVSTVSEFLKNSHDDVIGHEEQDKFDELDFTLPAFNFRDEISQTKRLKVKPTLSTLPLHPAYDSDSSDEGIVRTSSESSSTSTSTQLTITRLTRPESPDLWYQGFTGPKLTPTKKENRSTSLLDIRWIGQIHNDVDNNAFNFEPSNRCLTSENLTKACCNEKRRKSQIFSFEANI